MQHGQSFGSSAPGRFRSLVGRLPLPWPPVAPFRYGRRKRGRADVCNAQDARRAVLDPALSQRGLGAFRRRKRGDDERRLRDHQRVLSELARAGAVAGRVSWCGRSGRRRV